jgi:hypothetical protein
MRGGKNGMRKGEKGREYGSDKSDERGGKG